MPQQKRSGSSQGKRGGSSQSKRSSSAKSSTTKSSGGSSRSSGSQSASSRSTASRSTASGGGAQSRSGGGSSSARTQEQRDEALLSSLTTLRETLAEGVVITSERVQEAMDDAVRRGKVTSSDAQEIVTRLVNSGRQQTRDLLDEIEALVTRGRGTLEDTARRARKAPATDRVLKEVDRARRVAGLGPSFPITDYENLTAAQVTARLDDLSAAELRKVRDHEGRNANRKSVLAAVDKKLG